MGLSIFHGTTKVESDLIALIHHAINSGIALLDTSDVYSPEINKLLLGEVRISRSPIFCSNSRRNVSV